MEKMFLKASDGYELSLNIFLVDNPIAVVQVAHGMEEHKERYKNFATFLQENGFIVVTCDMRGHGENCENLGFFKKRKGYLSLIDDQVCISNYLHERFKDVPLYLFAHSMGTIISRVVLQKHSALYDKVILSGYPCYQSAVGMGIFLAGFIQFFKGAKGKSTLIAKLCTGNFNKSIAKPKTEYDWISYNELNVKRYIKDPLCGFGFTISAYKDLLHLVKLMHKSKKYENVNENLKMLLMCGADDPCVGGEEGTLDSYQVLLDAGFKNIERITYRRMRHELINEADYYTVFKDILKFLDEE